jgi:hypothetical protein
MTTSNRKQFTQFLSLAICVFAFVGIVLIGTANVAYCETSTAVSTIKGIVTNLTNSGYTLLRQIIVPVCIVALAAAGFQFIVGGTQGSEKARKTVIAVVCALAFVVFAPVVVNLIGGEVANQGNANFNDYNPLD